MKHLLTLLVALVIGIAPALADKTVQHLQFKKATHTTSSGSGVDRAPEKPVSIELEYDDETGLLTMSSSSTVDATVYIINSDGEVEATGFGLNGTYLIINPGWYTLAIEGEGWSAETEFQL